MALAGHIKSTVGRKRPPNKLTHKQKTFVDEFLLDLNATQAAIRAGYSEKTATEIDEEMRATIKFHDEKAKKLLRDNIDVLHKIVEVLMKEETIEGSYIMDLLGPKKSKVEPVGG